MPPTVTSKPLHPKILSPIERPYVFTTVHPANRTFLRNPGAPPPRIMPGAVPQLAMQQRPIASITPVRPRLVPTNPVRPLAKMIPTQAKPYSSTIKATPILSSPAVNIIPAAAVSSKSLTVAVSNPVVSLRQPVSVTISNPVPVSTVLSVPANQNTMTTTAAGVMPITKIRPSLMQVCCTTIHCYFINCWLLGTTASHIKKETKSACTTKTNPTHPETSHTSSHDVKSFIPSPST